MADTKSIELTLAPLREAAQSTFLTHGPHTASSTRQYFMRVALVADIPNNTVVGGIKDVVQGNRELYNAQPSAEMAARC